MNFLQKTNRLCSVTNTHFFRNKLHFIDLRFFASSKHVLSKDVKDKRRTTTAFNRREARHEHDLDFYGITENTHNLHNITDNEKLEDVNPQEYLELGRIRYGPKSPLESQMPFGSVRFDRKVIALDGLSGLEKNEKQQKVTHKRSRLENRAMDVNESFGQATDIEKQPQSKLRFCLNDKSNANNAIEQKNQVSDGRSSFIDEHFFQNIYSEPQHMTAKEVEYTPEMSVHDNQKTYTRAFKNKDMTKNKTTLSPKQVGEEYEQDTSTHFIEDQYFVAGENSSIASNHAENTPTEKTETNLIEDQYFASNNVSSYINSPQSFFGKHYDASRGVLSEMNDEPKQTRNVMLTKDVDDFVFEQRKPLKVVGKKKTLKEFKTEKTAYEVSREVRTKLDIKIKSNLYGVMNPKEYDSMGGKILEMQVPHLENVPSVDVIKILQENIIYNDNDILAINKPYGLPSHGGPGVHNSIGRFLGDIIPSNTLHLVHRLDKETTGVMLLAKSPAMYDRLKECFRKREVQKRYLAITKNAPKMINGVIDIPIAEGTVNGKGRMVLRPYNTKEVVEVDKKRKDGHSAKTAYRVLSRGDGCAIVECMPITGLKHQVRIHLAFGLNCPILGDHKYAHLDRLAPMRLHPDMLDRLKIRQSKVRHLAMHLHARSIMIPEFLNGKNLFISAALPMHFVCNMRALKLKLPPNV